MRFKSPTADSKVQLSLKTADLGCKWKALVPQSDVLTCHHNNNLNIRSNCY